MKITEVLEHHGMTLREVARAIGMKPSTLQTTIDGNPTIGTLRKIAEAAKCPLAEFFADELAEAGLEIVKSEERIMKDEEPGGGHQPLAAGQQEPLRPAGSIICPSCGEIIKLGVLR